MLFCVSFSLSLLLSISCSMASKRKSTLSRNPFISEHLLLLLLLPLMFGSMMIKPDRNFWRTFLGEAFIQNAKSFCQTSSTLTFPLSSTIRVGSHYVMSRSLVHPCLYMSSTPTCTDSIIQYLSLLLTFKVCALWSLQILYPTCSMSLG